MFSLAALKALQIYGIAIAISMFVAVLIKVLVVVTSRMERPAKSATSPQPQTIQHSAVSSKIPDEVVAAISAAISIVTGPHRILHIAASGRSWSTEGRSAQHHHQPRH